MSREEARKLQKQGLLECVNEHRKLFRWTHRANVRTARAEERAGGLLSLDIERNVRATMAKEMDRGSL